MATADTVDVETYAHRLAQEVVAHDAMAGCAPAVGAWTTKPAIGSPGEPFINAASTTPS